MNKFLKYSAVQIMNECMDTEKFQTCLIIHDHNQSPPNFQINFLSASFLLLLIIVTSSFIFYMCSNQNSQPLNKIRHYASTLYSKLGRHKFDGDESNPSGNSKVIYSKLDNETTASTIDLDLHY